MIDKINFLNKKECEVIKDFILENEERIKSLGPDEYYGTSENSLTGRYNIYNFMYDMPGEIILPKLKNLFKLNNVQYPISIQSWANIFRKNENILMHRHTDNPNDNFICANLFIWGNENIGTNFIINGEDINHKNNMGEIMFFPNYLYHYVNKNMEDNIRITMAFDIHPNIEMQNKKRFYVIK
jgi:hypothetical protein